MASCMAAHAVVIHLFGCGLSRIENLRRIAAVTRVVLARPVTAIARHPLAGMHDRLAAVWIIGIALPYLVVTVRAGFSTQRTSRTRQRCWLTLLLCFRCGRVKHGHGKE